MEAFFPQGATREELKKRFKALAADLHPDRVGGDSDVEDFKRLSAEYKSALAKCTDSDERELLHRAWMSLGGLMALTAAAYSAPATALTIAETLGSVALLSTIVDFVTPDPSRQLAAEGEATTVTDLYRELDEAIEREDYDSASAIKTRIDERLHVAAHSYVLLGLAHDDTTDGGVDATAATKVHGVKAASRKATDADPTDSISRADAHAYPMPPALMAWGCDEELWGEIENKKSLLDLLRKNDEVRGRARINRLRRLTQPGAGPARRRRGGNKSGNALP